MLPHENKIRYLDVDILRISNTANNLIARKGQRGVAQTEISGNWLAGFDQDKLKRFLEIN
jgi:hypothetical protein